MKCCKNLAGSLFVLLLLCGGYGWIDVGAAEESPVPLPPSTGAAPSNACPNHVDLRPTLQQWGLTPRVQGARPTCSVFTVVGALEFGIARQQGHVSRLSVEFLNWAGNQVVHQDQDGGFFSDLWKGFAAYGICAEEEFPYQPKFGASRKPAPSLLTNAQAVLSLGLQFNWIKRWNVKTGLTDAQVENIKRILSRGWPVCGGFRWPKQAAWEKEVLQMCPPDAVYDGHSLLLIGYRDDAAQSGGGIFLFRNTSAAGRDGAMPYAYAQAYMNDAAWVDFDLNATEHALQQSGERRKPAEPR